MGRKPLDNTLKQQIILLTATGSTPKSIAEQIERTVQTVGNYQKKYADLIAAKKIELLPELSPKDKNKQKKSFIAPPPEPDNEDEDKEEEAENEDEIEAASKRKFVSKGSEFASDELRKMYKELVRAGQSVMDYQQKYQKSLEQMGVPWDKFIEFSFLIGYDEIEEAYEQELRKHRDDEALAAELEEALEREEIEHIKSEE